MKKRKDSSTPELPGFICPPSISGKEPLPLFEKKQVINRRQGFLNLPPEKKPGIRLVKKRFAREWC